ncbi:MAG: hypothetical protein E5W81_25890 [Mesorhizobium sp.]|nr:MAG: hypothetical protein E5W81_25890 [Mesorhizobium sp.]
MIIDDGDIRRPTPVDFARQYRPQIIGRSESRGQTSRALDVTERDQHRQPSASDLTAYHLSLSSVAFHR